MLKHLNTPNHNQTDSESETMAETSLSKFHSFDNHRVILPNRIDPHPNPQVFVICLASYNTGYLYGRWIDVAQSIENFYKEIQAMLSMSPVQDATKWAIYAAGGFGSISVGIDEDIALIRKKAVFIACHNELKLKLLDYFDNDFEEAQDALEKRYQGKFESELIFAGCLLDKESGYSIPDFVKLYIDYCAWHKDIFANDYFSIEIGDAVHVFSVG